MIATKFVICLLVVVTMGSKLNKEDYDDDGCLSDPCQNGGSCIDGEDGLSFTCSCPSEWTGKFCERKTGSPQREADKMSTADAGDGGFMPLNNQTDDGLLTREADSEEDSVGLENEESHNSTLSRQASYPTGCGFGRSAPSHLAIKIVKDAFDTYYYTEDRRDAIWRGLKQANKDLSVVSLAWCVPAQRYTGSHECVKYGGWYSYIFYN